MLKYFEIHYFMPSTTLSRSKVHWNFAVFNIRYFEKYFAKKCKELTF